MFYAKIIQDEIVYINRRMLKIYRTQVCMSSSLIAGINGKIY